MLSLYFMKTLVQLLNSFLFLFVDGLFVNSKYIFVHDMHLSYNHMIDYKSEWMAYSMPCSLCSVAYIFLVQSQHEYFNNNINNNNEKRLPRTTVYWIHEPISSSAQPMSLWVIWYEYETWTSFSMVVYLLTQCIIKLTSHVVVQFSTKDTVGFPPTCVISFLHHARLWSWVPRKPAHSKIGFRQMHWNLKHLYFSYVTYQNIASCETKIGWPCALYLMDLI